MKTYYPLCLTLILVLQGALLGQTTTIATYTAGDISSDHFAGTVTTSMNSACPGILNVSVPAGRYVTSIDVEYQFEAIGSDWISEQSSLLECVTTATKEAAVTPGPGINSSGNQNYNRTGLTIANGVVPAGGLQFKLHAWRSFSGGGCGTAAQHINNNTFKVMVHHVAAPTCLPPSAVSVNSVTATSANISWTTGGASDWQIEYGAAGFTPGTGTLVAAGTNPYTLSGLAPSTRYDFRVRDSCGVNDVSFWTGMSSFRTSCNVTSAPWNEDFESVDWVPGTSFFTRGDIDTCFTRDYQSHFTMKAGPPPFLSTFSGPSGDHTSGTGKYIYSERLSFGTFPDTAYLITPPINLGPLTIPELTFWYHMFGPDVNKLEVFISNNGGNSFTSLYSKTGQQQTAPTDPWKEAVISLSAYANDTVQLKFISYQTTTGVLGDVAIDDIDIHEQPSCPKPSVFRATAATANSVTLAWTTGGATNWQVEYGPPGFTLGTGTKVQALSNPFTITGLAASTTFDFYVRDSCSATDKSAWTGPATKTTPCAPTSAPYMATFNGPAWDRGTFINDLGTINSCWVRDEISYVFKSGPPQFVSTQTGATFDHTNGNASGKYLYAERINFTAADTATIFSVPIDLSPLTIPEMSFWYHMYGADIDKLTVYVSNNHGASYNQVGQLSGQKQNSNNDTWKELVINLSAYANDTIIIKFEGTFQNFGTTADICIDDLSVHEQPTCPKPQNLELIGYTNTTAILQWTSGGASDWNIEYGPPGFTPGNGTLVNATTNPFTITGLSPSTTYDFYVRDSCGVADVSQWVGLVNLKTDCNPGTAPYTESFDGSAWTVGTFPNPGNIHPCWTRDELVNYQVTPMTTTTSFGTGPQADHTSGTGKFASAQRFFGTLSPSTEGTLTSRLIDLSQLTVPELTFWYHMFGADIDSLTLEVFDGTTWNHEGTIAGQQQTSKTDPWEEFLLDMSAYANDTVKLRFRFYRNSTFAFNSAISIDDVDIHEQPTCPKPTNFGLISTTANSITLGWTTGGATNWNIEYGPPGFIKGTGSRVTATTNPYTISGLNSSTTYEFNVRDSCSATDTSLWVGPLLATTDCLPLMAPFSENFDSSPWVIGAFFNDTGSIGQCWTRMPLVDYFWKPGPPVFGSTFTGPTGDHTTGSGKFVYAESVFGGGTAPFDAFLETPLIALDSLTVPELSFWYHMFGTGIGSLSVEIDDGSGYTQVWSKSGQQQTSNTDPWKEAIVNMAAYANDTVQIRFKATKASFTTTADAAIDDIDIHEAPSCPKPQDLMITGTTNSSVTLSWTSGGASDWNIEYGSPGFTPGSGTVVNATTNPFTVTGLAANTGYEFYVRDSCGTADVSDWIGPVGDTTDCNPVAAPYVENFDGSVWQEPVSTFVVGSIDACWERDLSVNYQWGARSTTTIFGSGPSADHTSGTGKFIYTHRTFGTTTQSTSGTITTPLINTVPLTTPEMSFWYHMFGADIDSLVVEVFDGASWQREFSIAGQQQNGKTDAWKEAIVDISSYANDTIKVRFKGYRNTTFAFNSVIAIDDLSVHEQPSCPKPSNLVATATTGTSVTLSWTSGGASNWQIEYGPSGFTPGSGTVVAASTNPFTVPSLSSSTTYDFYVRDSCGVADVSQWFGPFTISTDCLPVAAPLIENFDGVVWQAGPNFNDSGTVDVCWIRPPHGDYLWRTGPPPFTSNLTGPSGDHTSGNGKYIFAESIFMGGTAPFDAIIESPAVDLSSLTNPELRFWYHMFGTGIGGLVVEVDDGSGFAQVWSKTGQQQTSNTDPWAEAIISLASYANDTIVVRFKASKPTFSTLADVAIDDFSIDEAPSCPKPMNLSVTSTTTTTVTLSWTTGGATNWLVGYKQSGSAGPVVIVPAATNPFTVTGLNPSTSYDFFVKDSCAAGDVSAWSVLAVGSTQCGVATAPWSENFDGSSWVAGTGLQNTGNQINSCWTRPSINNPNFGTGSGPTTSTGTGPSADVSGIGNYIYTEASGASGAGEITTPSLYIPVNLVNPRFKFYYHMFGSGITSLGFQIDNGSGFGTNVLTITGQQQTSNLAPWAMDSISLTAYAGDTIRIKIIGTNSGLRGDIAIDEVAVVSDPVACAGPASLSFTAITATGFTVNWVSSATSTVEVVEAGQAQGTGTLYNNVSSPLIVTGLQSSTGYDVYVRDSCGAGLLSPWVSASDTTLACPAISASFSNTNNWLSVNFDGTATTNADSLHWNFGDGNIASGTTPTHGYSAPGSYLVTLSAFSDCGDTATISQTIQVCDTLKASFSDTAVADSIIFDASGSANATSYKWNIEGADTTAGATISWKFTSTGTQTVTLTVYNDCGDSATLSRSINTCPPAQADWTYNIISTTSAGMKVQFDGTASVNAVSYDWDFGDGNTGTGATPQHTYVTPGLFYLVRLTVKNSCGNPSARAFKLSEIGLEEVLLFTTIKVYPNPADDQVNIAWDATDDPVEQVEVIDAAGRVVIVHKGLEGAEATAYSLDIDHLPPGNYTLRLSGGGRYWQQKLIVR